MQTNQTLPHMQTNQTLLLPVPRAINVGDLARHHLLLQFDALVTLHTFTSVFLGAVTVIAVTPSALITGPGPSPSSAFLPYPLPALTSLICVGAPEVIQRSLDEVPPLCQPLPKSIRYIWLLVRRGGNTLKGKAMLLVEVVPACSLRPGGNTLLGLQSPSLLKIVRRFERFPVKARPLQCRL